jgi:hypothetical protein
VLAGINEVQGPNGVQGISSTVKQLMKVVVCGKETKKINLKVRAYIYKEVNTVPQFKHCQRLYSDFDYCYQFL